jgi:phenylpropionate dioxygenase-like ring-hydroxylating dioxygenase large terminal subunit
MTTNLTNVTRPIEQAQGLPNAHYLDPAVHLEERDALLFDEWAAIGVASDLPAPGDARPLDFLGLPLLLLRDREGQIRVFHNICRHRGMILVSEPRRIEGAIRCPYHSWCYGTDGRLVATPHVGGPGMNTHPDLDRSTLGLVEIPSHVWRDVIFVNINGNAAPFEDHHADLIARWAEFETPLYHGGADSQFTLNVASNWKLAVENYCESYHLPWVHPGLNAYSRLEDHYNIEHHGKYAGQGTLVYRQLPGAEGEVFPDFPGLSAKWDEGAEYAALFPNVLFGVQRDHAFAIVLIPTAQNQTQEQIHLYYAAPETDPALRAANTAQWKTVFKEDIGVVEGMQRGRHATGFDGGVFSPAMDGPTHCFHKWVAEKITAHRQQQAAE